MEPRPLADIAERYDGLVRAAAHAYGADAVCSTTRWIIPAAAAFAPRATPQVFEGDSGVVALLEHENPRGPVFTSFDTVWGFATPLIGADPVALIDELQSELLPKLEYYALSMSGIDPAGPLFEELQRLAPAGYTETADRCVADLSGGFDQWLSARSPRFRRSLRTARRDAEAAGLQIERIVPDPGKPTLDAIERILDIEARSWKTGDGTGLVDTDLGFFTRAMAHRFARTGDLRIAFARRDTVDVGYVIGGIVDDRYRGFQHSFDQAFPDLSIGKYLQHANVEWIAEQGITTYDLGMHMPYKASYSDRTESTITIILAGKQ